MLSSAFLEATTILLREGLEALLVLAALAAYLDRIGAGDRLGALYAGAGAAVVTSIGIAWALELFNNGVHSDLLEAATMLAAAGLMFYVSGWLFLKQDPHAWQAYLKAHTDRVVAGGTLGAVAALSFLAVFREGAETALFLHALAQTHGGWSAGIAGGIAAAIAALAVLFIVITRTTRRLPLRAVFLVTSAFLFLMGLRFVGEAIQELQEQALVDVHPAPAGDTLVWLGLNATWEAVGTQLAIVVLAALGLLMTLRHGQWSKA